MTPNIGILKEPRGFIRVLQFIFAIFAFATASGGSSDLSIIKPNSTAKITAEWSYPYDLRDVPISTNLNKTQSTLSQSNDIKPSAEFFVFTGVTAMLITLALEVIYILFDQQYRIDDRFSVVDLVVTVIWTIFWLAGSAAWAQGVSNLRAQTNPDYVMKQIPDCGKDPKCIVNDGGTYANVTVSVIFGFLNFLLWLGSIWFIYKDTRFFKNRSNQQQQQAAQNQFSNIGAPQTSAPQIRVPGTLG